MAQDSRQYELVLLGATGYTGKLTAEWIHTHLPTDLKWAIAGRSEKKLQSVVDELKEQNPNRRQPAIETCTLEKTQLTTLAKKTKLLITTIGPFMHYGEPVLAACAENGTHYLDCTGEVPWYHDMVSKYHEIARQNHAIIIPECGLDSVPADMMAFSLANHVWDELQADTASVTMTLYKAKAGFSGGTLLTMLDLFDKYGLAKLGKTMKPFSLSPVRAKETTPPPSSGFGYKMLGLLNYPDLGGIQTAYLMAGVDTCIVHRSWGIYQSNPNFSYGPKFRFTEYMRAKNLWAGFLIKFGISFAAMLFAIPITRWLLAPIVKKYVITQPGDGPDKEARKKEFMSYRAVATADTWKEQKVKATLDVAHGGYETTALTLSAAADVILRGRLSETEAGRLGGGILTPATLGEPFVKKLDEFGMKIKVGVKW